MTEFTNQLSLNDRHVSFKIEADARDPREQALGTYMEQKRVPEPELVALMMRAVRPGDVVLDAGANVGFFTLLLSQLVGPTGKVIAVEPSPQSLTRLRHNLKINSADNVTVVPKALWALSGETLKLCITRDGGYDSLTDGDMTVGYVAVETITLRDAVSMTLPRFMKIDIEKAETTLLSDIRALTPAFVAMEVHDAAIAEVRAHMEETGYLTYILHESGALPSRVPKTCTLRPKAENSNLLFSWGNYLASAWPEVVY